MNKVFAVCILYDEDEEFTLRQNILAATDAEHAIELAKAIGRNNGFTDDLYVKSVVTEVE